MQDNPKRILIVDDDADIVANLADILRDIGYQTESAMDGSAALKLVDLHCSNGSRQFDLCLLDFKMPGIDGVELFEQIRAKLPQLKAIMMTAYAGDDGVKRAVAAGTWKVLRKPVDIKKLLLMIDEAVA